MPTAGVDASIRPCKRRCGKKPPPSLHGLEFGNLLLWGWGMAGSFWPRPCRHWGRWQHWRLPPRSGSASCSARCAYWRAFCWQRQGACCSAQQGRAGIGCGYSLIPPCSLYAPCRWPALLFWHCCGCAVRIFPSSSALPMCCQWSMRGCWPASPTQTRSCWRWRKSTACRCLHGCGISGCRASSHPSVKAASPQWACAGRAVFLPRSSACRIIRSAMRSTAPRSRYPRRMCSHGRW